MNEPDSIPEKLCILVVDDEPDILTVTRHFLESLGIDVLTASDAESAEDLYKEHLSEIDMIILDIIMPRVSGRELYEELRSINPSVKALFISGYSLNGTIPELLGNSRTDFLQKPFSMESLIRATSKLLAS